MLDQDMIDANTIVTVKNTFKLSPKELELTLVIAKRLKESVFSIARTIRTNPESVDAWYNHFVRS